MNNLFYKKIQSSTLLNNTIKLSSSNLLAFASVFIFTPIISRLYSPELYGEWGVFSNVLLIFGCILFLSYDNALIQTKDDKEISSLLCLCMLSLLTVTIIVNICFLIGKYLNLSFFVNFPGFEFLALSFFLTGIYNLLIVFSNRTSLYSIIAVVTMVYGLAQPLLRILFGLVYLDHNSLIYAYLLSLITGIICYSGGVWSNLCKIEFRKTSPLHIRAVANKYIKYPAYDAPSAIIEALCTSVVVIILSAYFAKEEIGCYTMVMQLIILPISVVGGALSKVFFRELSIVIDNTIKMKELVIKTAKVTFLLSIIPVLFFSFGGDFLLGLFLGEKWVHSGQMVLCLSIFSIPIIISEPLMPIFKAFGRQEIRFKYNIVNISLTLLLLYIGIYVSKNIMIVLLIYSIGVAIMRFSLFYIQLKLVDVKILEIHKGFFAIVVLSYIILGIRLLFVFS